MVCFDLPAVQILRDFIAIVNKARGKRIDEADADVLIADAQEIIVELL